MKVAIVYDSRTGNTASAAEQLAQIYRDRGHKVAVASVEKADPVAASQGDVLCVGSFLESRGLLSSKLRASEALLRFIEEIPSLVGKEAVVFCSYDIAPGDALAELSRLLEDQGGQVVWSLPFKGRMPPSELSDLALEATRRGQPANPLVARPSQQLQVLSLPPSAEAAAYGGSPYAAEQAGDHRVAAELFHQAGDHASAARCYAAAALTETADGARRALARLCVDSARRADTPEIAIALLVRMGDLAPAAELAREAGDPRTAAAVLVKAGNSKGAAELLAQTGDWLGAARVLAAAGDPERGIGLLAAHDPRLAVDLAVELRRFDRAAEIAKTAGDLAGAARALATGGRVEEAVRLLAPSDKRAAAILAADHGANELAIELYLRVGDPGAAANLASFLNDPRRAADLYRRAGDVAQAARQYQLGGDVPAAAAVLFEAGRWDEAAELFGKLGDRAGLAACLEKQGKRVEATRAYLELGRLDRAEAVMRLLPEADRNSPRIRIPLAICLLGMQQAELAIGELRPVVGLEGLSDADAAEAYYQLGIAYQLKGDNAQAAACYRQLLLRSPRFRDAELRLAEVGPRDDASSSSRRRMAGPSHASLQAFVPERYEVEGSLGSGSMGVVFRARDTVLDRPVAVKVLRPVTEDEETVRSYFLREAKVMAALNHPAVVTIFDAGANEGVNFLVMELLEGIDLKERRTQGPIEERTALRLAAQVADALAAVHRRSIVHRDVKPANVFLLEGGERVKLMDFGVAHEVSRGTTRVAGTPFYMAPEQMLGEAVSQRTDIYALGGTLYFLLTGEPPFPEKPEINALRTPAPDPRVLVPSIRTEVASLVLRCLAKEEARRPPTATALRKSLEALARA